MKLLYIINYLTDGGPSKVAINQAVAAHNDGHDVSIFTITCGDDDHIIRQLKQKEIKIRQFKLNKSLIPLIKNVSRIRSEISNISPDIIHVHGIVPTFISAKVKYKKMVTIHNNIFEDYKYTYGRIKGRCFAHVHLRLLRHYNKVVCCSKNSASAIKSYIPNIEVVINGVDIEPLVTNDNINEYNIRKHLGIPKDAVVFIYVGVVNRRKRVVELVELFKKYSIDQNEYLLIVGSGDCLAEAKHLARDNKRIIFTGFTKDTTVYMSAANIYISNSASEGFSISIIEALTHGLKLLLSDIDSHRECLNIYNSTVDGELFNEENFCSKKESLGRSRIRSQRNVAIAKKNLTGTRMYEEYLKIYNKLLSEVA